MRKSILQPIVFGSCLLIATTFFSCSPPEDEQIPPDSMHADYLFIPWNPIPLVTCPTPGDNCSNPYPHPGFRTDQIEMLNTFYRMSENDSASYFFNNYDWPSMFPELNARAEIVSKVINGNYKVKLMTDSSVVVVSAEAYHSSNIIFAFNRDCEPPAN
jgi:hypothetical protein